MACVCMYVCESLCVCEVCVRECVCESEYAAADVAGVFCIRVAGYVHTHTHTHTHANIHNIHTHTQTKLNIHTYIYTHLSMNAQVLDVNSGPSATPPFFESIASEARKHPAWLLLQRSSLIRQVHVCRCACMHACVSVSMSVSWVCACPCACACACVCACVYVFAFLLLCSALHRTFCNVNSKYCVQSASIDEGKTATP